MQELERQREEYIRQFIHVANRLVNSFKCQMSIKEQMFKIKKKKMQTPDLVTLSDKMAEH